MPAPSSRNSGLHPQTADTKQTPNYPPLAYPKQDRAKEGFFLYKVVIIGGGWSGCAAALAARKAGAEVTLLEKTDMLLGLGNVGWHHEKQRQDSQQPRKISHWEHGNFLT